MRRSHHTKPPPPGDASALRIGIVVSDFNADITSGLLAGALSTLMSWRVADDNITIRHVPGAYELPMGCQQLLLSKPEHYDALIALGCVLKGETKHDEYISSSVAHGLMHVMLDARVPIAFGVLTPNTLAQAKARSRGAANKGAEAAVAALQMASQ